MVGPFLGLTIPRLTLSHISKNHIPNPLLPPLSIYLLLSPVTGGYHGNSRRAEVGEKRIHVRSVSAQRMLV